MQHIILSLLLILTPYVSHAAITQASIDKVAAELKNTPVKVSLAQSCVEGSKMLTVTYINQKDIKVFIPQRAGDATVYQGAFLSIYSTKENGYLQSIETLIKRGIKIEDLNSYIPIEGNDSVDMTIKMSDYYILNSNIEYHALFNFRFKVFTAEGKREIANNSDYVTFVNNCDL